jgi:hypothetical protein
VNSLRRVGNSAGIRNVYLPNTSLEHYRYINLLNLQRLVKAYLNSS